MVVVAAIGAIPVAAAVAAGKHRSNRLSGKKARSNPGFFLFRERAPAGASLLMAVGLEALARYQCIAPGDVEVRLDHFLHQSVE